MSRPLSNPYIPNAALKTARLWSLAIGIGLLFAGVAALTHLATAASIGSAAIGATMMVGGALGVLHGLSVWEHGRGYGWALGGAFYLAAGCFILFEPGIGRPALALALAFSFAAAGIGRLVQAMLLSTPGTILSGMVSILAALLILAGWPTDSLWVIGLFVATDLIVQGASLSVAGLVLKPLAR